MRVVFRPQALEQAAAIVLSIESHLLDRPAQCLEGGRIQSGSVHAKPFAQKQALQVSNGPLAAVLARSMVTQREHGDQPFDPLTKPLQGDLC